METRRAAFLRQFLESKNFGLVIGLLVFLFLSWVTLASPFRIFQQWDRSLGDLYFQYRSIVAPQIQQEGVVVKGENAQISPDILILGVDNRSLETLGQWPFSRSVHADFLNTMSRVQDQSQRERAVFFDFFFLDREKSPENDWAFVQAIQRNQRVFLETIYAPETMEPDTSQRQFQRLEVLLKNSGTFSGVKGTWQDVPAFFTLQAPLIPFGREARGHGSATFTPDHDSVFRRQTLVSKVSQVIDEIDVTKITPDLSDYQSQHQRYVYTDKQGLKVTLPPLTQVVVADLPDLLGREALPREVLSADGSQTEKVFVVQKIQDFFLPSITLSLALEYWHKTASDVEVIFGSHILIPSPALYDPLRGWTPAPYSEVRIPIDDQGAMAINYMGQRSSESGGEYQTFPVRSYASYATKPPSDDPTTWPESRQLAGKLVMVGQFSTGAADDEKSTPFGQMFGVEMHANALNTILMRNFLVPVPPFLWVATLFLVTFFVAFYTSRMSTFLSLFLTFLLSAVGFFIVLQLFESAALVYPYASLLTGILLTFVLVIVYRALTEEREKRKVRGVFSKYVSPDVVTQLLQRPPELGGVDQDLTVLFSDIRGFTSLSEVLTPQELVAHLNLYLTAMTDLIHEYKGTLDKYVGDEIMCFWGAPLEQPDHAELACKCALRMIEKLEEMNSGWPEDRKIRIGIGLNSGTMTVGNMGSAGRMNYTLMGDNVNLGARLEGTNKEYLTNIIMSESTYQHIQAQAVVRELDNIRVKGKNKPVLIYELIDFPGGIAAPKAQKKK